MFFLGKIVLIYNIQKLELGTLGICQKNVIHLWRPNYLSKKFLVIQATKNNKGPI